MRNATFDKTARFTYFNQFFVKFYFPFITWRKISPYAWLSTGLYRFTDLIYIFIKWIRCSNGEFFRLNSKQFKEFSDFTFLGIFSIRKIFLVGKQLQLKKCVVRTGWMAIISFFLEIKKKEQKMFWTYDWFMVCINYEMNICMMRQHLKFKIIKNIHFIRKGGISVVRIKINTNV